MCKLLYKSGEICSCFSLAELCVCFMLNKHSEKHQACKKFKVTPQTLAWSIFVPVQFKEKVKNLGEKCPKFKMAEAKKSNLISIDPTQKKIN